LILKVPPTALEPRGFHFVFTAASSGAVATKSHDRELSSPSS
jgi:hypothetical protein